MTAVTSIKYQYASREGTIPASSEYTCSIPDPGPTSKANYRCQIRVHRVGFRARTVPLSHSLPNQYFCRFKSRPLTTPKIFGFDKLRGQASDDHLKRGVSGFFPPIKLRAIERAQTSHEMILKRDISMGPVTNLRGQHVERTSAYGCPHERDDVHAEKRFFQQEKVGHSPTAARLDDLSYLPKPLRIGPKKDSPWVYRYKVKRSMNKLSKIMASKPVLPNS